ncbi:MAG: YebC/PmpR family DNA-binding transcriptional regulator [Spirochaetales bacterium]|nr:YebC/PmpR family DNA-binding transcriptional regulator [Spirochaetales bacterium]
MAGHSKWANIKHRKALTDKKRGAAFTRITRELMVSARLGGTDPSSNTRLRIAMNRARAANIPRDTMERAIKKGAGELQADSYEEILYEAYAPGGVGVLTLALTDKKSRTTPEIKSILTKYNFSMAEPGAVSRLFERKGQMIGTRAGIAEDELMELALEAGALDLSVSGDDFEILTAPEDFSQVMEALEGKALRIDESGVRLLPLPGTEITVDLEKTPRILSGIEKLEDHDDVQAVYHNLLALDE